MERNKAAASVTSDEIDTALHGAARQNIKWDACISGNFHPQPPAHTLPPRCISSSQVI